MACRVLCPSSHRAIQEAMLVPVVNRWFPFMLLASYVDAFIQHTPLLLRVTTGAILRSGGDTRQRREPFVSTTRCNHYICPGYLLSVHDTQYDVVLDRLLD